MYNEKRRFWLFKSKKNPKQHTHHWHVFTFNHTHTHPHTGMVQKKKNNQQITYRTVRHCRRRSHVTQHAARHKRGVRTPSVPCKRMKTLQSVAPLLNNNKVWGGDSKTQFGVGGRAGEGAFRIPVKQEEDWRGAGCTTEKGTWEQEVSAHSHLTKELYCC